MRHPKSNQRRVLGLLAKAAERLQGAHLGSHAASAKRMWATRAPGLRATRALVESDAWMKEQGVKRPDRFVRMFAPGLWPTP
jgi:hypothetical protein